MSRTITNINTIEVTFTLGDGVLCNAAGGETTTVLSEESYPAFIALFCKILVAPFIITAADADTFCLVVIAGALCPAGLACGKLTMHISAYRHRHGFSVMLLTMQPTERIPAASTSSALLTIQRAG